MAHHRQRRRGGTVAPGTDNLLCRSARALLTGAAADRTAFTPDRVIPHPPLASTGPALAGWTDASGRPRLELLSLGADRCLHHRSWTGNASGTLTGVWPAWDSPICGGIVGPSAADAWVDASGRARIELLVRTSDGSHFHGSCVGGRLRLRIDVYAVRGSGRCVDHRSFVGNSDQVSGFWTSWTADRGCGGIIGPAAAASGRSGQALNHDVMVRTSSNALFARRCVGTESSCAWQPWLAPGRSPGQRRRLPTYHGTVRRWPAVRPLRPGRNQLHLACRLAHGDDSDSTVLAEARRVRAGLTRGVRSTGVTATAAAGPPSPRWT